MQLTLEKEKLKDECNYGDKSMLSAQQMMERSLLKMRMDTSLGFEDDLNQDALAQN